MIIQMEFHHELTVTKMEVLLEIEILNRAVINIYHLPWDIYYKDKIYIILTDINTPF